MADLFFPQLKTGAIAQYPIRKVATTRTVSNLLQDGSVLMYPDDRARRATWSWDYLGLTLDEAAALQEFFDVCNGPLRPFTFLDPAGNLLSASSSFREPVWQAGSSVEIVVDLVGPLSGTAAVTVVNEGQALQEMFQTLPVPSDYTYSCSFYVSSQTPQPVILFRRSIHSEETVSFDIGTDWRRVCNAGNLHDQSTGVSIGIKLAPGQKLSISAAQVQAQPGVSPYVDRPQSGDIYPNAHWALQELTVRHVSPNNCAVGISIDASVGTS